MTLRFRSVFHLCEDFQKSSEFYLRLGFKELEPTRRSRRFQLSPDLELHLHGPLSRSEESSYGVSAGPVGRSHVLSFTTDCIDELYESLENTEIIRPLAPTPWGKRMFLISDPDGYVIEFQEGEL